MNLLDNFSERANEYLATVNNNPVYPSASAIKGLQQLGGALQDQPIEADEVLALLDDIGSPATVKTAGGRYFGFVIGGVLPAALSAKLMATIWDQNAGLTIMSPTASYLEETSSRWLLDLLNLPSQSAVGFVTGDTMANFCGLAAARRALLKKQGWDVEAKGLFGAPEITVITGDEVHVSLLKALNMLGMGRERILRVASDEQGRIIADQIPNVPGPRIICTQAGNVNTGSFDPIGEICRKYKNENTWVHVDGAFGLWAAVSEEMKYLTDSIGLADSWATDAHKWLNVPYDSGLVFVKNKEDLAQALSYSTAAYLPESNVREPYNFVPEMSRAARGVVIWAALKSLGKKGLAELIERNCHQAVKMARQLELSGCKILNDVVLNQVLVSFGDAATNNRIIKRIQDEGTCWCGGTVWQGKSAMRISISSWKTTDEDIEKSLKAILKIVKMEAASVA